VRRHQQHSGALLHNSSPDRKSGDGSRKIDWRPNDKNTFSFSMNYQHFNSPDGIQTGAVVTSGGALNSNGNDDVSIRYGRASWTFVPGGSTVNERGLAGSRTGRRIPSIASCSIRLMVP